MGRYTFEKRSQPLSDFAFLVDCRLLMGIFKHSKSSVNLKKNKMDTTRIMCIQINLLLPKQKRKFLCSTSYPLFIPNYGISLID